MRIEDILILELCKKTKNRTLIEDILRRSCFNCDYFLSTIDRHLIEAVVLDEIIKYSMPEQLKKRIAAVAREAVLHTVLHNQMLKKELLSICTILMEHGIECILMKGLSLNFTGIRTVGDIDILIKEKDLLGADKIVALLDYYYVGDTLNPLVRKNEKKAIALQLDWNNQFQYYNSTKKTLLEVHTNFFERSRVYMFDLDKLLDNINIFWANKVWNENLQSFVMCSEDVLLLMCLHAALKRAPYANQFVVRNILDIAFLIERGLDWDRVMDVSTALGISSFILFSLKLSNSLLDVAIPLYVLDDLAEHCTSGQMLCNRIHFRCFHDLESSWFVYTRLYKMLAPFVYQKRWIPRLKNIFLIDLFFPPKRTMARFFNLEWDNPLVYATYMLNPIRWLILVVRRMRAFFR